MVHVGTQGCIFISYRRGDASGVAGRLYDRLAALFGADRIFMDVDSIAPGYDFQRAIAWAVSSCDVVLALIGQGWLDAIDEQGRRRLDDPYDFVGLEISNGLDRNIPVIPVLLDGAVQFRERDLPHHLGGLARRQSVRIDHESFSVDVNKLVSILERVIAARQSHGSQSGSPSNSIRRQGHAGAMPVIGHMEVASQKNPWKRSMMTALVVGGALAILLVIIIMATATRQSTDGSVSNSAPVLPALSSGSSGATPATVFDVAALQRGVASILENGYHVTAANINCPSHEIVQTGVTFDCMGLANGVSVTIPVRITSNAGDYEVGRPTT